MAFLRKISGTKLRLNFSQALETPHPFVIEEEIVYCPKKVDANALHPYKDPYSQQVDYLSLPAAQVRALLQANLTPGKHKKNVLGDNNRLRYDILVQRERSEKTGVPIEKDQIYAISEVLGKGASGIIRYIQKLTGKDKGKWFAIKQQLLDENDDVALANIMEEHSILMDLNQSPRVELVSSPRADSPQSPRPNHVQNPRADVRSSSPIRSRPSSPVLRRSHSKEMDRYGFVMNLASGDPLNVLLGEDDKRVTTTGRLLLSPALRIQLAIDICKKEFVLLNKDKYLHRDLKVQNIIIDIIQQIATWVDAGKMRKVDANGEYIDDVLHGTAHYLAPELIKEYLRDDKDTATFHYNEKTEVYAIGVILAELFSLVDYAKLSADPRDMYGKVFIATGVDDPIFIKSDAINYRENTKQREDLLRLIHKMTDPDPIKRCHLTDAIKDLGRIKQEYLMSADGELQKRKIEVGMLDVDTYLRADEAGKRFIMTELTGFDEIWFADTRASAAERRDKFEYTKLKQAFERENLIVGDRVYISKDLELGKAKLDDHLQTRAVPSITTLVGKAVALELGNKASLSPRL